MAVSWLEDDVIAERSSHTSLADVVAIAACIAAVLLVRHHLPENAATQFSTAKTPHALIVHHPGRVRKA